MRNCDDEICKYEYDEVRLDNEGRSDLFEKAKTNRARLKKGLKENKEPSPIGLHTQGGYAMKTITQHVEKDYDIDDGAYFTRESLKGDRGADKTSLAARQMVADALKDDRFKKQPEVRGNCVRVYYDEGYHIDVPVYRVNTTKNQFSGKDEYKYELASADWKASDARAVTKWFQAQNQSKSPDASGNDDGQVIRMVRLLKAFRRSRSSWKSQITSGFGVTKLVADHYASYPDRDDTALRELMKAISARLAYMDWIDHPVLLDEASRIAQPSDGKSAFLKARLDENLEHLKVLDKADCTHAEAMKAWDNVFNTDWFSKQPDTGGGGSGKGSSSTVIKQGGSHGYASE